jgi:hypothetical protein
VDEESRLDIILAYSKSPKAQKSAATLLLDLSFSGYKLMRGTF